MRVHKAYRYELKPNKTQEGLLMRHAGTARFAWNWALAERKKALEEKKTGLEVRVPNAIAQHRTLNGLKKRDFPWMYEVSKCAPQEALRDLDLAFRNFFAKRARFPKFKKKGLHDSFTLTGTIKVFPKYVRLPRLGKVRTKEDTGKLNGRILSATVSREADRWYAALSVEVEVPDPIAPIGPSVGIDLGLKDFAVIHDGKTFVHVQSPKALAKRLKRLVRLSKKHSRKLKGSVNRRKSALALARLHRRIKNTRKDFLHKLSSVLAKTKPVIAVESLNVKGLVRNRHLARHIADAGWGAFLAMLKYKSAWYGSQVIEAGRWFPSSKTCSSCGLSPTDMPLSVREWTCPGCGTLHDRDENASRNLWLLSTGSSPGSHACGDPSGGGTVSSRSTSRGSWRQESLSGNVCP